MQLRVQAIFYNNPDLYPPVINGTRLLVSSGFSVDILCREYGGRWSISYPATSRVRRITSAAGATWRQYLEFVIRVLQLADRNASLYLGHDMHGLLPARLLATLNRRPLVYQCHDFAGSDQPLPPGSRLARFLEHCFARTADLVIVPDAERGEVMSRELRLKHAPLVVANSPPFCAGQGKSRRLQEALERIGLEFDQVVFRQGVIGPNHAIEATIRSMPLWEDPAWIFAVMGVGESSYIEHLQRVAAQYGVRERFAVLPPVGYDEVLEFTVGADVGHGLYEPSHINHMYYTTASNKIMEYMACGIPVLVSDRPGLRDLVESHRCGVCADQNSPQAIAAAVNMLLRHREEAGDMGKAGRHAFETVFCYERQFAPLLEAFRSLSRSSWRSNQ